MTPSASDQSPSATLDQLQPTEIDPFEEKNQKRLRAVKAGQDGWEHELNAFCGDVYPVLMGWAVYFLYFLPDRHGLAEEAVHTYLLRFIGTGISKFSCGRPILPFLFTGLLRECQTIRRKYKRHAKLKNDVDFECIAAFAMGCAAVYKLRDQKNPHPYDPTGTSKYILEHLAWLNRRERLVATESKDVSFDRVFEESGRRWAQPLAEQTCTCVAAAGGRFDLIDEIHKLASIISITARPLSDGKGQSA